MRTMKAMKRVSKRKYQMKRVSSSNIAKLNIIESCIIRTKASNLIEINWWRLIN